MHLFISHAPLYFSYKSCNLTGIKILTYKEAELCLLCAIFWLRNYILVFAYIFKNKPWKDETKSDENNYLSYREGGNGIESTWKQSFSGFTLFCGFYFETEVCAKASLYQLARAS